MDRTVVPLTRSLGALEILDASLWYARDHAVSWVATAASGGIAFAVGVAAFLNFCASLPRGSALAGGRTQLVVASAFLAILWLLRGLGHWAAVMDLKARVQGNPLTVEACWIGALRRIRSAIFHAGVGGAGQWAGILLAVWPGLLSLNNRSLSVAAAGFEDVGELEAEYRARGLMRGSTAGIAVWGILLLAWAVLFVNVLLIGQMGPAFVRSLLGMSFPSLEAAISMSNPMFIALAAAGTWALCDGLRVTAFAVLYLNARMEREGGDLLARMGGRVGERRGNAREVSHV